MVNEYGISVLGEREIIDRKKEFKWGDAIEFNGGPWFMYDEWEG